MKQAFTIRNYLDKDYLDVKENLIEGNLFDEYIDTRENLKNKITKSPNSIIVIEKDQKIIANIFIVEDEWISKLYRLVVKKEFRKQGIGSILLNYAENILKNKGYKYVSLFIQENDLKNFYFNNGYELESKKKFQLLSKEL